MKRAIKMTILLGAIFAAQSGVAQKTPENIYQNSCRICHDAGVANAPRRGDAAGWEPRLEKGMDTLVQSVIRGVGAMPPGGMCTNCSADDYKAVISFMASAQ